MLKWQDGSPLTLNFFQKVKGVVGSFVNNANDFGLKFPFTRMIHHYPERQSFLEFINLFQYEVFPMATVHSPCLMLNILNFAQPEWIFVGCHEEILHSIVCVVPKKKHYTNNKIQFTSYLCLDKQILYQEKCFLFQWRDQNNTSVCPPIRHNFANLLEMFNNFNFMIYTKPVPITPILHQTVELSKVLYFEYNRELESYMNQLMDEDNKVNGYEVCISLPQNIDVSSQTYTCRNGVLISISLLFDGQFYCEYNTTDEYFALHHKTSLKTCKLHQSLGTGTTCSPLLCKLQTGKCMLCLSQTDSFMVTQHQTKLKAIYFDSANHTLSQTDLGWVISYVNNQSKNLSTCLSDGLLPCSLATCFNTSDICIYQLDSHYQLKVCASAVNLEQCEHFQCNAMYKCPDHYCVPWEYLCDRKWDCPRGTDEGQVCVDKTRCKHFFLCRNTNHMCIHFGNLCDNVMNCPHGDDEILCELNLVVCPTGCTCLALAVVCSDMKLSDSTKTYPYQSISFCEFTLNFIETIFLFPAAMIINLVDTTLKDVCTVYPHREMLTFQVVYNNIPSLKSKCFQGLFLLQSLTLSHNQIMHIQHGTFSGLTRLKTLNLSANRLPAFPSSMLSKKCCLRQLFLVNNSLTQLSPDALSDASVQEIHTDTFGVCCFVPEVVSCLSAKLWFESCAGILQNAGIESISCVIVSIGFGINCLSTCIHFYNNQHFHTSYRSLAVAGNVDFVFFFLYYCTLFVADQIFGETFVLQGTFWRSSAYCKLDYWFLLAFCLLSPAIKDLLSLTRLMVVCFPMDTRFKQKSFVSKLIFLVWSSSLLLSSLAVVLQGSQQSEIPTKLCSPFLDPQNKNWASWLMTGFLTFIQLIAMGIAIVVHILMFKVYKHSISQLHEKATLKGSVISMKLQLILLTFSACICWFPSCTVFLIALSLDSYPLSMTEWTTLTVVPLHSVLNPAVLLFAVLRQHLKRNRKNNQKQMKASETSDTLGAMLGSE